MQVNRSFFWKQPLPYVDFSDIAGKLIVVEGTDGVGRSTQIEELKMWLQLQGYGVVTTGWSRSLLVGKLIDKAKTGHNLNIYTFNLLYLADFADRFEHEIVPALKAGFVVLADRYIYTALARAAVRGADKEWIRSIYGFALVPDIVFYLKISVKDLVPRVINSQTLNDRYWAYGSGEGMDYWESGMDMRFGNDLFDSFVEYQKKLIAEFDYMADEFGFVNINASQDSEDITRSLKEHITGTFNNE